MQVEIRRRSERRPPFPQQACGIRRLQRHPALEEGGLATPAPMAVFSCSAPFIRA